MAQGPLPYLAFCGTEIANGARTIEYLRSGLADTMQGHWDLGEGGMCGVLYRVGNGTCLSPDVFGSPQGDPAPWYDASEPGSTDFLGLLLLELKGYDSTIARSFTPRPHGLYGASWSAQRRRERTWRFKAVMVSASDAGAEYGLRWLTNALKASECDTCDTCEIVVRIVCPPEDCTDDDLGEWISYDAALVDGPHEVEQFSPGSPDGVLGACRDAVIVEWTMVAGNPFLYKRPEACSSGAETLGAFNNDCAELLGYPGGHYPAGVPVASVTQLAEADAQAPVCCEVVPPDRGTLSAIFTFDSISGMGRVDMAAYTQCPTTGDEEPELLMRLQYIPADSLVVVDTGQRTVTITATDPDTGDLVTYDGQDLLEIPADRTTIEWIEVRDCDELFCICAKQTDACSQGGDTTVTIETQLREG